MNSKAAENYKNQNKFKGYKNYNLKDQKRSFRTRVGSSEMYYDDRTKTYKVQEMTMENKFKNKGVYEYRVKEKIFLPEKNKNFGKFRTEMFIRYEKIFDFSDFF